jgi:pimeloyl-ACP methyl ester carboxylesterase
MDKVVDYKGKRLAYQVVGNGPAVVLIHGFGEETMIWKNVTETLTDYTFIIPSLPGTGSSEMTEDMSMEGLAESIYFILKEEKVQQCVMIGHSMGGYITLAFVDQYPAMLKGYGLFHSTAYADSTEKIETRKKGISFIEEQGADPFLKTSVPNLYSPATKEENPALIEDHVTSVQNMPKAALITYYKSMIKRPDRTHLLKESPLPVLFVLGKWDTAIPLTDGLKQCHLPHLSYIHILNKSGHMGMLEEKEKSNKLLNEFLSATL